MVLHHFRSYCYCCCQLGPRQKRHKPWVLRNPSPEGRNQAGMKSCWSQACQLSTIKITSPGSPGPSCTCCSRRCRTPCTSCNLKLLRPGHPDPECTWSSPCTACSHRRHHPANKAVRAAVCTHNFFTKPSNHILFKRLKQTHILQTFVIACPGNFRQLVKHNHRRQAFCCIAAIASCMDRHIESGHLRILVWNFPVL